MLWKYKFQTETFISTKEAEIISMYHSCKELPLIINMIDLLGQSVGLPVGNATINVSMHEDNVGELLLIDTLPTQLTPRSKHY